MPTSDAFFDGFLDDYYAESDEHLTAAADALLRLDKCIGQPSGERAAVDDLFRYFHTLKAISAMVELRPAERLAHHLEHYLRAIREGERVLSTAGSDVLIEGTRRLEHIINAHRAHHPLPPIEDMLERIEALVASAGNGPLPAAAESTASESGRRWICRFTPTRDLLTAGIGVDMVRRRLAEIGTIVDATPDVRPDATISFRFTVLTGDGVDVAEKLAGIPLQVDADTPLSDAAVAEIDTPMLSPAAPNAPISHVVRVDLARLDHLMRSIGDMVITRARLAESLSRIETYVPAAAWRTVQENSIAIDRQLRMLREGIMRVRMVPVGEIFRRMPLVVRDLARENSKRVQLELQGQATEIDKYLIERMMDPVLHLVRNAVSHGIEPPEVRMAQGKRPEGTITLSAAAVGDMVTLEIADDGYGVDAEAVVEKARQAGISVPTAGPLDAATILTLLCTPGFSTKEETDRASGRGVGMAVVKAVVEELSGTIALDTEPGQGTRFIIRLPVTLAITDALIGRVGDEAFAIPQGSVREVIEVNEADVRQLEDNEIAPYRDGALSLIRLSRVFGINRAARSRFHVFVLGHGSSAVGIVVDRIIGQREIVVRTIADPLVRVEGISGATDLGDGRVVLILDPAMLARLANHRVRRLLPHRETWGKLRAGVQENS